MKDRKTILEIRGLNCSIEGTEILDSVSLSIPEGTCCAVLGPNGAGKTTLLKCVLGIVREREGAVLFKGREIKDWDRISLARSMAYVPQVAEAVFDIAVQDFLLMGRYPYKGLFSGYGEEDRAVVRHIAGSLNLIGLLQRNIRTLSGGERQKVLLAGALVQEPELIVMDEPAAFLDPAHEEDLYERMQEVREAKHMSIVFVTHDINRAVLHGDIVCALKKGRVVYTGKPEDLTAERIPDALYERSFAYTRHPSAAVDIVVPNV